MCVSIYVMYVCMYVCVHVCVRKYVLCMYLCISITNSFWTSSRVKWRMIRSLFEVYWMSIPSIDYSRTENEVSDHVPQK